MPVRPLRALTALIALAGCGGEPPALAGEPSGGPTMAELQADVALLRDAHVYFNHASVGDNILEGLGRLDGGLPVRRGDGPEAGALEGTGILHTRLGSNGQPLSKLEGFAEMLGRLPRPPDVAIMKFCYADILTGDGLDDLFTRYQKTYAELQARYPTTRFLHVTVPLASRPEWSLKGSLKALLGREGVHPNEPREVWNERIRRTYGPDLVFDLAKVESTRPDGRREQFEQGDRWVPALLSSYTTDGGHLNALGQDVVARAFAHRIAEVLRAGAKRETR
jgi:hypothetical protein